MADKLKAAAQIRNFANLFKQLGEAADALDAVGSIEQATAEANRALESKRAELEEVTQHIADITNQRSEAEQAAKARLAKAEEEAQAIIDKANAAAAEVRETAQAKASDIQAKARGEAEEIAAAGEKAKEVLESQLAILRDEIQKYNGQLVEARSALSSTKAKLEEVRGQMQKMLG